LNLGPPKYKFTVWCYCISTLTQKYNAMYQWPYLTPPSEQILTYLNECT
jgi:hypothetical protein